MDYITIRYYSRDKEVWVVHRELQARLEEIAGEKPTWCPVISPYNEIEQAVFTELAAWGAGNRNVCRCGKWLPKSRETCLAQGLPYPPAEGWENAGPEYYVGVATRTRWRKGERDYPYPAERFKLTCDPLTCAFAQGRWDKQGRAEYRDAYGGWPSKATVENNLKLCHIHCVVPLLLPFVEDQSPRAVFLTSSWYSAAGLARSWENIRDLAGGIIAGLPLKLVLEFPKLPTPRGMQHLGIVHFDPGVPWRDLPALGEARARALRDSVEAQRELAGHLKMLDGLVEEVEAEYTDAFVREHNLPVGEEVGVTDFMEERFRRLAAAAGWTEPAIAAVLDSADAEELLQQVRALEEAAAGGPRQSADGGDEPAADEGAAAARNGIIDAEFEEETARPDYHFDAENADYSWLEEDTPTAGSARRLFEEEREGSE